MAIFVNVKYIIRLLFVIKIIYTEKIIGNVHEIIRKNYEKTC